MATFESSVLAYYTQGKEDARLCVGEGRLEFWRTQDVLRRALPAAPARVLDGAQDFGELGEESGDGFAGVRRGDVGGGGRGRWHGVGAGEVLPHLSGGGDGSLLGASGRSRAKGGLLRSSPSLRITEGLT
ncbi:hypothetical protein [Streptomyces sp. NBC_01383]|uniref:hypothetical protein n=1 Tax=Streptomyces sp. NBC_01383 TaxID=2903846 RepID=UPI003867DA88